MIKLYFNEIEDDYVRENFERLSRFINDTALLRGEFQHFELSYTYNPTSLKVRHSLGFIPKDVIQTFKTGTGSLTYNYSSFTRDAIDVTVSGASTSDPVVVRFFVGRYRDEVF